MDLFNSFGFIADYWRNNSIIRKRPTELRILRFCQKRDTATGKSRVLKITTKRRITMGDPRTISELLNDSVDIEEKEQEFDYEMAVRYAADTLRMCIQMKDKKGIIQQIGAIGALGIELEDLRLKPSDLNYVVGVFMGGI